MDFPLHRCAVTRLKLSHFRSYDQFDLACGKSSVVLSGPNGAGKTNILEALSFLAPGRGLRRAKLAEIDRIGSGQGWAVSAELTGKQGAVTIGTGRDPQAERTEKRIVRVEGKALRGHGELANYLSVLWLVPSMDQLFLEGGSARRRFIDRLVYSFDSAHASRLASYEHSLRERNRLLGDARFAAQDAWLETVEHKIAARSVEIVIARSATIEHLNAAIALSEGSFPKASIHIAGELEQALSEASALEAENRLSSALAVARAKDAASGRTSLGAHVSEVTVTHLAKGMEAAFCSTGEQKALLLSIILAQARAGAIWHRTVPLLLLDEVVAHLDSERRKALSAELASLGAQAWLTGTDAADFSEWHGNAEFVYLTGGY